LLAEVIEKIWVKIVPESIFRLVTAGRGYYNFFMEQDPVKYHLGCGTKYLPGFVNVDFPPSQHSTIGGKLTADLYADILTMEYKPACVIESHHVFEHFNYVNGFALLIRWTRALVADGMLHLDVPDVERLAQALVGAPVEKMFRVMRYLYGDQSETWAYHINGWTPAMLADVLLNFGFQITELSRYGNPASLFPNCGVFVKARKAADLPREELLARAKGYFYGYLNVPRDNPHPAEQALYRKYCAELEKKVPGGPV
jgi:hypothetical protein